MDVGDVVDDFEALDQNGESVSLSSLVADGPMVLFFYPKAMTPGCTKESCHFRDLGSEFDEVNARRVGVSADPVDKQHEFDTKHDLGFPLLADTDKSIAKIFGVKRFGPIPSKRATFVVDQDRRVIATFSSELDMDKHADVALEALKAKR